MFIFMNDVWLGKVTNLKTKYMYKNMYKKHMYKKIYV